MCRLQTSSRPISSHRVNSASNSQLSDGRSDLGNLVAEPAIPLAAQVIIMFAILVVAMALFEFFIVKCTHQSLYTTETKHMNSCTISENTSTVASTNTVATRLLLSDTDKIWDQASVTIFKWLDLWSNHLQISHVLVFV